MVLPRDLLRGLIGATINRKDGLESRDLKDLEDMWLERRESDLAVDGLEPLGGDQQHPKPRAADVVPFLKIDHQAPCPAIDDAMQLLREAVRSSRVQPSRNLHDTDVPRLPLRDFHDVPPSSRPAHPRSAACS